MSTDWRSDGDFLAPGEASDLDSCAREALHLLPFIQPAGVALVAEGDAIVALSANCADHPQLAAAEVGARVSDVLGASAEALASRSRPTPLERTGSGIEWRAHRSRSGPFVVEGCLVEDDDLDVRSVLGSVIAAAHGAVSLDDLVAIATRAVRDTLGFDRVWCYRFADDESGHIIAEARRDDDESFLGLRFAEGDIPKQARAMYLENRVRIIRDVGESVPLAPAPLPDGTWLDTSDLSLRAVSPIHLTYLRNMGTTASASLALVVDGRLWGLISGHHYSGPRRLSSSAEELAGLIADLVALQIASLEALDASRVHASKEHQLAALLARVGASDSIMDALIADRDGLLEIADATGCVLRLGGLVKTVGVVPDDAAVDDVFDHLDRAMSAARNTDVIAIDRLRDVVPTAASPHTAGLLALALSAPAGNWVVWFRPEVVETVTYGDRESLHVRSTDLDPVNSFAKYAATVEGRCASWSDVVPIVSGLRSSLGAAVFQQSEALSRQAVALRSANAELDRFAYVAAHDLKEPLRGIHNYTDLLAEDFSEALGGDGERYIAAVRRLAGRMSGLVESLLTYATIDRSEQPREKVMLSAVVADAIELAQQRIDERGATVELQRDTPVYGDRLQLVQVMTNLISNAVKYTAEATTPLVEIDVVDLADTARGWSGWPQHNPDAPEPVVVAVRDNGIGVDEAMRDEIFEVFRRLHGSDEYGGGSGAGLTIARRIAERHDGALWVEPRPSGGSTFYLALGARPSTEPEFR